MPCAPAVAKRAASGALQKQLFQKWPTGAARRRRAEHHQRFAKMSCSHVVADEVARGNFEDTGPDRDWGDRNEALLALQRLCDLGVLKCRGGFT